MVSAWLNRRSGGVWGVAWQAFSSWGRRRSAPPLPLCVAVQRDRRGGRRKALIAFLLFELVFLSREMMKKLFCILRNTKVLKASVTPPHPRWSRGCSRGIFLHSGKTMLKSCAEEQHYCPGSPPLPTLLLLEQFPVAWGQREKEGCGNSLSLAIFFPNY